MPGVDLHDVACPFSEVALAWGRGASVLSADKVRRRHLDAKGDWLPSVLDDACTALDEMRRSDHDAAGLVLAMDTTHAEAIARILQRRHGIRPVVATSADPQARTIIEAFSKSRVPWAVAVKMISEGVDIPRLRVGVYATTVATELFFRQVVGRFVRVEDPGAGEHAAVFIPDDPRLRGFAAAIAEMRDHVLDAGIDGEPVERVGDGHGQSVAYLPIASEAADTVGIVSGQVVDREMVAEARRVLAGLDVAAAQRLTVADVALVLIAHPSAMMPTPTGVPTQPTALIEAPWRERKNLRAANNRAASRAAYKTGLDHQ